MYTYVSFLYSVFIYIYMLICFRLYIHVYSNFHVCIYINIYVWKSDITGAGGGGMLIDPSARQRS